MLDGYNLGYKKDWTKSTGVEKTLTGKDVRGKGPGWKSSGLRNLVSKRPRGEATGRGERPGLKRTWAWGQRPGGKRPVGKDLMKSTGDVNFSSTAATFAAAIK